MSPIRPLLLAISATLALAACASADDATVATGDRDVPPKPPAVEPAPPANEGEVMKCDDSNMGWAIGQLADEALVTRVRTETDSKGVRVIKPGMAVTMDYREDRVNIDVDANNKVVAIRCG